MSPAVTAAPILDVLAERWSTRIFDAETPIDEAALAIEAGRPKSRFNFIGKGRV